MLSIVHTVKPWLIELDLLYGNLCVIVYKALPFVIGYYWTTQNQNSFLTMTLTNVARINLNICV